MYLSDSVGVFEGSRSAMEWYINFLFFFFFFFFLFIFLFIIEGSVELSEKGGGAEDWVN